MTERDLMRVAEIRRAIRERQTQGIRELAGVTQTELAATLGVSRSAVSLWESGARAPRGAVALKYAALLAVLASGSTGTPYEDEDPAGKPGLVANSADCAGEHGKAYS